MLSTETKDPMTIDELKKLSPVKATSVENLLNTGTNFDQEPQTEVIDGRRYPKGMVAVGLKAGDKFALANVTETDHFYPTFSDLDYFPKPEPKKLQKPRFIGQNAALPGDILKTIFGTDDRKVYYSTAYPWRCVGRVETALGFGSGVMIGPRHLLTCSHIIDWQPNNQTGWLKFTPMYYNGSAPYGVANGIRTYYMFKVSGPTIDGTEAKFDYTVVVLDKPLGNSTGWMGSKSYTDNWDGQQVWTHAGYPADLTGTQRPTYQTSIALDGDSGTSDDAEYMAHKADVYPGQSGGPFWGYWAGQPYAVATQSAQNANYNTASGGSDLAGLVNKARTEFP